MENYNLESRKAGWDSPERAHALVEPFIHHGSVVLDIGIGTGLAVSGYTEKGATIIGLDHDQSMLDAARLVVGKSGDLRLADINKPLPLQDLKDTVDVVQAIGVLEFARNIESVFDQISASVKKDGMFVFTTESADTGLDAMTRYPEAGVTVYRHSTQEIKELLDKSGFSLVTNESYTGYTRGEEKVPYHIFLVQKH